MKQPSPTNWRCWRLGFAVVLFSFILALAVPASAQESVCKSHSDCLRDSLARQWDSYYTEIERAWRQWREIRQIRDQVTKAGDAELLAEFANTFAESEQQYRRLRLIGDAIASQAFRSSLLEERTLAVRDRKVASERLALLNRTFQAFLRADKGGIGDDRRRLIREIEGFALEQVRLEKNMMQSGIGLAMSATTFAANLKLDRSPNLSQAARGWLQTYDQIVSRLPHTIDVQNLSDAQLSGDERAEAWAIAGMAAREASNVIGLLSLAGVQSAARMSSYLGPAGLIADVVIFGADAAHFALAMGQLGDAQDRLTRLESDEQAWRGRIHVQGQKVRRQVERLARADTALAAQSKVATLMQTIANEDSQ